jgi:ATP-dependent RNA helicase DDX3X
MADSLNMNGLNLGPSAAEQQGPTARTYMPPHMRNKGGSANGGPPVNMDGAAGLGNGAAPPPAAAMNGLNSSAWAKYVIPSFP